MTELEKFVEFMDEAIKEGKGIQVLITMPDLPQPEMITNPACNVKAKSEYYKKAYNDNLELKAYNAIKIEHYQSL
jgi:hypothetical protein